MLKRKLFQQTGYTVIEVMIVIALMGLMLLVVLAGNNSQTKDQLFSGNVQQFANILRQAQVNGYDVRSGVAAGTCTSSPIYWRGDVLEFNPSSTSQQIQSQLLCGGDVSQFSSNDDQRLGLTGKELYQNYSDQNLGLDITGITYAGATVPSVSIAFLSPDGRAYVAPTIYSSFPLPSTPYYSDTSSVIVFTLKDGVTNLTGTVTFDPTNGTISSKVQ